MTKPAFLWTAYALHPQAEWKFCPTRKWKFDWAWPKEKIAVEIEGGIYRRTAWGSAAGAHSRPQNILRDMEKYNEAAKLGWRVFRFTPKQLSQGQAQMFMRDVLF